LKVEFRGCKIDAVKIEKIRRKGFAFGSKEYERLTPFEKDIVKALLMEEALTVFSDQLYIAFKTDLLEINSLTENILYETTDDATETLIPLFFSYNLNTTKSDYLKNKKLRDKVYAEFKKLIKNRGLTITKLKDAFKKFHYNELCYFSVTADFDELCEEYRIDEHLMYARVKQEVYQEYKDKLWGFVQGLILGGLTGPFGIIIAIVYREQFPTPRTEQMETHGRPWNILGATIATGLLGYYFFYR